MAAAFARPHRKSSQGRRSPALPSRQAVLDLHPTALSTTPSSFPQSPLSAAPGKNLFGKREGNVMGDLGQQTGALTSAELPATLERGRDVTHSTRIQK